MKKKSMLLVTAAGFLAGLAAACVIEGGAAYGYVGDGDRRTGFYEKSLEVSPGMPEVFRFRMTEGDLHSLEAPGSAVIPESMARRMFGDAPATGNMLMTTTEGNTGRTITGVYRDFPRNASVQNVIYLSMDPEENFDNWQNWNYYCYVRLRDPSVAGDITREFTERYEDMLFGGKKHNPDNLPLELHSLTGLHFRSDIYFDMLPKTSRPALQLRAQKLLLFPPTASRNMAVLNPILL